MEYSEISVTLSQHQVRSALDDYIRKDFTGKVIKSLTFNDDGSVKVELKSIGNYMDR